MQSSKRCAGRVDWKFIEIELFNSSKRSSIDSSLSESPSDIYTNSMSSSSSQAKSAIMLIVSNSGSFYEEAMNIDLIFLEDDWIQAFRLDL